MKLVEPFQTLGTIEGGGLGQLLRCRDVNGIMFAAKFPKDHDPDNQRLVADEERRFQRHQGQHVVSYYGPVHHFDGRRGFAMELMDGSLSALVATSGAMSPKVAIEYFSHAAAGLHEIHSSARGAFHGDIKLGNILYKGPVAKIADFGLARGGLGQTRMLGPHSGGTPGYLPPEGYASAAGDVYSLGVTLWAMLAGCEPPRNGKLHAITVAPPIANLINGMLSPQPTSRLTMSDVLGQLSIVRSSVNLGGESDWFGDFLKVGLGIAAVVGLAVGIGKLLEEA
jgi:serine/threonine protein kinase